MFREGCDLVDINQGCNSALLTNNSFFRLTRNQKKIYLIHTTKNKDRILADGFLYPSSGCLMGSVYLVPGMEQTDGTIRVHNLGAYYYQREAPLTLKLTNKSKNLSIFIIELIAPDDTKIGTMGVNYLKFGKLHLDIYKKLTYLLNTKERNCLEEITSKKILKSLDFLLNIADYEQRSSIGSKKKFFLALRKNVQNIPILGYVYFEALNKTMMLHQDDPMSKKYAELGEFYNWHYKDLMTYLYPYFFYNFNLGTFNPDFEKILGYISDNKLISHKDAFVEDFYAQVFRLVKEAINMPTSKISKRAVHVEDFSPDYEHLLGHMIHRELRNFDRYPNFYFYFDQIKALEMWNFWNQNHVIIPFNSIIPKGEIGLNPAHLNNFKYKIYDAENIHEKNGALFIEKGKVQQIQVATRLVDHRHLFLRNY